MNRVLFTERVPAPDLGSVPLFWTGALVVADVGLLVSAFVPSAAVFLVLVAVLAVAEVGLLFRAPFSSWALTRIQGGAAFRGLIQGVALLVLYGRSEAPVDLIVWAGAAVLALHLGRLAGSALAEISARQRRVPILTRGLDLAPVVVPKAPPRLLARHASEVLSWPMSVLTGCGAVAQIAGASGLFFVGAGVALALVLTGDVVLGATVLAMRRVPRQRFGTAVERALTKLAPEVVLYHAGGVSTVYQLQSWLETVERLDAVNSLVIMRDRDAFNRLGPTRLPVLCVEHSIVVMELDLPDLRLVLYPSHATGNLHMLRRAGVRHAFVGHGDSDKPVTVNPFLRAYREIWVAGPAAHDRFEQAGLGLDGERIVEVGRPQLDPLSSTFTLHTRHTSVSGVQRESRGKGERLTVLYAPTWEGFEDEPNQTSVGPLGLALLERLLAEADVRVLYRPHPMAGTRDPAVQRAHREIVRLLGEPEPNRAADAADPAGPAMPRVRDELEWAGVDSSVSRSEYEAAQQVWTRRRLEADRHQVVAGPDFDLLACFEVADVLLCDVSSVITEFLPTGRPYGVTNPGGRSADEFAVRYPSSRGGYLIGDAEGLDELLAAGRSPTEHDPAASERVRIRERLLGPVPAMDRFRQAVR